MIKDVKLELCYCDHCKKLLYKSGYNDDDYINPDVSKNGLIEVRGRGGIYHFCNTTEMQECVKDYKPVISVKLIKPLIVNTIFGYKTILKQEDKGE